MPLRLPLGWIVTLNIIGWPIIQLGLARLFLVIDAARFDPQSAWFRPRRWEQDGRFYQALFRVRSWKSWLPDAAPWFGGFAKARLSEADVQYLRRFAQETCRGELAHLCMLACAPVFIIWNPLWADAVMIAYAAAANLPCVMVQRYNRGRVMRAAERRLPVEAAS
jgi:glycosyl-4,4'-diaponeurosporenoate acyltransferase